MSSANLVAEIRQKLSNKKALTTGGPCTCEYVTMLQSFHRGKLIIHWYIAQNFQPTCSMSVLFRRSFKTAISSRFLKVAIVTSNFFLLHIYIYTYINFIFNIPLFTLLSRYKYPALKKFKAFLMYLLICFNFYIYQNGNY